MINIVAKNLNKYFNRHTKNEIHVINDTSISFNGSGLVCILGESGSGKTTLLNVLSGIDKANSGEIYYNDVLFKNGDNKSSQIRNNSVGYVFQNYYMISNLTVYENLYLALAPYHLDKQEIDLRINYVLEAVNMGRYIKRKMTKLSGGQMQRIAIARALVKSPDVIFADEPTGNLDESTTLKIMMILKKISEKCLVIVATHERRIANFFADRIINIRDGKIISDQTVDENERTYNRVDDNNLYLQEYDKEVLKSEDEEDNITIYRVRDEEKLNFSIIVEYDKYYIKASNPSRFEIINPDSHIQAIDSKRPTLNNDDVQEFNYELNKPTKTNNGKLEFKYLLSKVATSVRSKSFYIMILAMILISAITIWGVGDFLTVAKNDVKSVLYTDSRIVNVELKEDFDHLQPKNQTIELSNLIDKFSAIEDTQIFFDARVNAYFLYDGVEQIQKTAGLLTTDFNDFTYLPLDYLDEKDLVAGRMPEKPFEVVIDEWVLDRFMKKKSMISMSLLKYEAFLNRQFFIKANGLSVTIVGISRSNNMVCYANDYDIYSFMGNGDLSNFITLDSLKKAYPGRYDNISLEKNEALIRDGEGSSGVKISGVNFTVVDKGEKIDSDFYAKYVISDEGMEAIIESYVKTLKRFILISNNKDNLHQFINDYRNQEAKDQFFTILDNDYYQTNYDLYMSARATKMLMRGLITLSIIVICSITLFITMKAHGAENMQQIMVYRLLGIKKQIIILMFVIEIMITSFVVMIPSSLFVTFILEFIEHLPASTFSFELSFASYIITIVSLVVLNVLVGILPVTLIMRKTPAQLVASYDI